MSAETESLFAEIGIVVVPTNVRRSTLGELECCCERTVERLIEKHGVDHARFVLRTICETVNNKRELVAPTVYAVSDVALAHPNWAEHASEWLDAFDGLDIPALRSQCRKTLRISQIRPALGVLIYDRLLPVLGVKRLV